MVEPQPAEPEDLGSSPSKARERGRVPLYK